jgi:hypothetical protein
MRDCDGPDASYTKMTWKLISSLILSQSFPEHVFAFSIETRRDDTRLDHDAIAPAKGL